MQITGFYKGRDEFRQLFAVKFLAVTAVMVGEDRECERCISLSKLYEATWNL